MSQGPSLGQDPDTQIPADQHTFVLAVARIHFTG